MDPGQGTHPPTQIVQCEKHGLRYNAATQWGCARCRREAGERPPRRSRPATGPTATRAPGGGSLAAGLAVAAILILVVSGGLYMVQQVAYQAAHEMRSSMGLDDALTQPPPDDVEELFKKFEELDEPPSEQGEPEFR